MGRASRSKAQRQGATPSSGGPGRDQRRLVWLSTAGIVILVAVIAGILALTRSSSKPPPASSTGAAMDKGAPASLVKAADALNFKPTTEPGVGTMEGKAASAGKPPANSDLLPPGTVAPPFTLKTPLGETVSLSQLQGKAVLLELFATWCPHCQAEAPHLEALYRSLPKKTYAFVAINGDGETAPSVFAYDRYFGLTFPSLLDPSSNPGSFTQPGAPGPVSLAYHLQYFPTFYVIGPSGKITWNGDGEQPTALLKQELEKAAGA